MEIERAAVIRLAKKMILAEKALQESEPQEEKALIKRRFPFQLEIAPKLIAKKIVQPEKPKQALPEKEELFELGKLTKYTIDRTISLIECPGASQQIKVKKENSVFQSDVTLTENEIMDIISKFSQMSGIPLSPIFRATVKKFSITAIISGAGSRFLIARI